MHPRLLNFFNRNHDALIAELRATDDASSAMSGASRENGILRVLGALLPPLVRFESGDLIDSRGADAGQVDGVVVHQTAPSVKRSAESPAIILAEGAIAVLEIKSHLKSQWEQVEAKYAKVMSIRRDATVSGRLPFFMIGLTGWQTAEAQQRALAALIEATPRPRPLSVVVVSLEPRLLTWTTPEPDGMVGIQSFAFNQEHRGRLLAHVWMSISEGARRVAYERIPWTDYMNFGDPPDSEWRAVEHPPLPSE